MGTQGTQAWEVAPYVSRVKFMSKMPNFNASGDFSAQIFYTSINKRVVQIWSKLNDVKFTGNFFFFLTFCIHEKFPNLNWLLKCYSKNFWQNVDIIKPPDNYSNDFLHI